MNTEDDEFERIERDQAMRSVPIPIHHTDTSETLEYITGWNDCRQAMLAKQPDHQDMIGEAQDKLIAEQAAQAQPAPAAQQEPEIVQRVKRYAGQTLRTARNPNITARECIELADWLITPQAQRKPLDLTAAIEYADARWAGVDVPVEWCRHFADALALQPAPAAPAAQGEPVARIDSEPSWHGALGLYRAEVTLTKKLGQFTDLYTTPQAPKEENT